jgi:hypothetical protein
MFNMKQNVNKKEIKEQINHLERKKWWTSVDKKPEKKNTTNVHHSQSEKSPPVKAVKTRKTARENPTSEDIFPPPQEKMVDKCVTEQMSTNVHQPKKRQRTEYYRKQKANRRAEQEGIKIIFWIPEGWWLPLKILKKRKD